VKTTVSRQITSLCASMLAIATMAGTSAYAQPPVLQRGYDANVSGANLSETTLTTSNVVQHLRAPVHASRGLSDLRAALVRTEPRDPRSGHAQRGVRRNDVRLRLCIRCGHGGSAAVVDQPGDARGRDARAHREFRDPPNSGWSGKLASQHARDRPVQQRHVCGRGTLENGAMAYRLHGINILNGTEPYGPGVLLSASYGGSLSTPTSSSNGCRWPRQRKGNHRIQRAGVGTGGQLLRLGAGV